MTKQDQARIMRADQARRDAREIDELVKLSNARKGKRSTMLDAFGYVADHQRIVRVSEPWRPTFTRCIGTVDAIATPSVRVIHSDGTREVRPVTSFRKSRNGTTRARVDSVDAANAAPIAKLTSADLPALGDQNH